MQLVSTFEAAQQGTASKGERGDGAREAVRDTTSTVVEVVGTVKKVKREGGGSGEERVSWVTSLK